MLLGHATNPDFENSIQRMIKFLQQKWWGGEGKKNRKKKKKNMETETDLLIKRTNMWTNCNVWTFQNPNHKTVKIS